MNYGGQQLQIGVPPFQGVIKKLVIINLVIWFFGQTLVQLISGGHDYLATWLSLVPAQVVESFALWQVFTYMFLHSTDHWLHIIFNMLTLWFFGFELAQRWGQRFFLRYYLVCGVGAAVIYVLGVGLYALLGGSLLPLATPVLGASGAVFGVMLAYALFYGERIVYFMMVFPMKARYMVLLIGLVELWSLLSAGPQSGVANLAHLGGLAAGYAYLLWRAKRSRRKEGPSVGRRSSRLKLVVDNEKRNQANRPKYWN